MIGARSLTAGALVLGLTAGCAQQAGGVRRLAPQLVAAGACLVASGAFVVRYGEHLTTATSAAIVAAALVVAVARRTGQAVLGWGAIGTALLAWLLLVLAGSLQVLDAWDEAGRGAATWTDVQGLVVAAGFALALVAVSFALRRTVGVVVQAATVVACWLATAAAVYPPTAGSSSQPSTVWGK